VSEPWVRGGLGLGSWKVTLGLLFGYLLCFPSLRRRVDCIAFCLFTMALVVMFTGLFAFVTYLIFLHPWRFYLGYMAVAVVFLLIQVVAGVCQRLGYVMW
jgi:hypothetical protein